MRLEVVCYVGKSPAELNVPPMWDQTMMLNPVSARYNELCEKSL